MSNEINRTTGHAKQTFKTYLKEDCLLINEHCDRRRPGKLAPYEKEISELRFKGLIYTRIHEYIAQKGYTGTFAFLRVSNSERANTPENISQNEAVLIEYIPCKTMYQQSYHELESVKRITAEQ